MLRGVRSSITSDSKKVQKKVKSKTTNEWLLIAV